MLYFILNGRIDSNNEIHRMQISSPGLLFLIQLCCIKTADKNEFIKLKDQILSGIL